MSTTILRLVTFLSARYGFGSIHTSVLMLPYMASAVPVGRNVALHLFRETPTSSRWERHYW